MPNPPQQADGLASDGTPTAVVRRFLDLLAEGRIDDACDLLADDVRYVNVPLRPIRGRERVRATLSQAMTRLPGAGFEVYLHAVSANGPVVLTERTDVLKAGRVRVQFWVCGRFDVHDDRITLWRDYFDWGTFLVATVRGLLGAALPILWPRRPLSNIRA